MFLVFIAYSYCEPVKGMCGKNSIFLICTWHWIAQNLEKIYLKIQFYIRIYISSSDCINENANNYILCDLHKR